MAKKPNNKAALKEQSKANAQSQRNFEAQMKFMQKQMKSAEAVQMPTYTAPSPGPTRSSQDVMAAGREMRMNSRRRYGFERSVSANNTLGGSAAL